MTIPIYNAPPELMEAVTTKRVHSKGFSKYPFALLEVGQTFMVPNKNQPPNFAELGQYGVTWDMATTPINMRNHCTHQNKKVYNGERHYKCSVNENWIAVVRIK